MQLALKTEEGATSQGMQVAHRNWKRMATDFPYSLQKELGPADTLAFELLISRTIRKEICVVLSH